jgi:hypothetical protein
LVWAIKQGPRLLIEELFGAAIAGASTGNLITSWLAHIRNFLLFGPTVISGIRPPWSTEVLLAPLIAIPIIFWLVVLTFVWKRVGRRQLKVTEWVLVTSGILVILGFILTNFGADPSGRYFLPLMVPLAVYAGGAFDWLVRIRGIRVSLALLLALLLYNASSTLQAAYSDQSGLTTQFDPVARINFSRFDDLIAFMKTNDIDRGYTNYWVAYTLAFRSQEEIIFTPRLPYHQDFRYTERDNRYPPYSEQVEASDRVAYIMTHHPDLEAALQRSLAEQGIDFKIAEFDPFTLIYDLSQPLRPDQLDLPIHQETGL